MKLKAYSIFDHASETYAGPFFVPKERIALRIFTEMANDMRTEVAKYPKDYELFYIGGLDTSTGVLTAESRIMVARASSLVKKLASNQAAQAVDRNSFEKVAA